MCGASIPDELERELNGRADDPEAVAELGVAYATLQCSDLLARGAPGIHFYTLNRSPATRAILAALRAAHPWTRAQATGLGARRAPSARGPPSPSRLDLAEQLEVAQVAEHLAESPSRSSSCPGSSWSSISGTISNGVRGPAETRAARGSSARGPRGGWPRRARGASRTGRPWPARISARRGSSTTSRLDRNSPAGSGD